MLKIMPVRRLHFGLICALGLMGFGSHAADVKPALFDCRLEPVSDYRAEPFVLIVDIPRLAAAPKIDGAVAENEWAGAAAIDNLMVPATTNVAVPLTKYRAGFDDQAVYFAFRCELEPGAKPQVKTKKHDGPVYDDDSIEFFIWPAGSPSNYYQLVVNSIGAYFDAKYLMEPGTGNLLASDNSWNPQWQRVAHLEQDAWVMEMAIPWKTLGMEPKGIKGLRLNICRSGAQGACRHSSWAYLPNSGFHAPDRFGVAICRFDSAQKQINDFAELGLGMTGLFRMETVGCGKSANDSQETRVICTAALPGHPVYSGKKYQLTIDAELLDRHGNPQAESAFKIASFDLPFSIPQQLVLTSSGRENYLLNMRMALGGITSCRRALAMLPGIGERFCKADLAVLSQKEPFKVAAYMGAAGCVVKTLTGSQAEEILPNLREVIARLDVLENGKTDIAAESRLQLLNLTGNSESQVVVEYPSGRNQEKNSAEITFYWGSIPLGSVETWQMDAERTNSWFGAQRGLGVFEGYAARIETNAYRFASFALKDFDPARHVLIAGKMNKKNRPLVLNIDELDFAGLKDAFGRDLSEVTLAVLPGCPSNSAAAVTKWAGQEGLMSKPLDEGIKSNSVLVVGDARSVAAKLGIGKQRMMLLYKPQNPSVSIKVERGRDIFAIINAPTRAFAEMALHLAMAGKPVLPEEADALRLEIVKAMPTGIKSAALPVDQHLFCGDPHMHTTLSDGATLPLATALETMYCNMDFAVMSDHNTIDGAVRTGNLLGRNGFAYPLIVGEEVTTSWAHMNAYPLREAILPTLTPEETVKAAHLQGAVIQWNHPGYTGSDFESNHLMTGLAGTGCDAWEHTFWLYDAWKKAGQLPVMVGSTDTHSGTFGWPERTIIFAPACEGRDLAEAIRQARAVMVSPGGCFFYGSDEMLQYAWSALKEGKTLKAAKAARLKSLFKNADIGGLLYNGGKHYN